MGIGTLGSSRYVKHADMHAALHNAYTHDSWGVERGTAQKMT
jgi:hypothetical protein